MSSNELRIFEFLEHLRLTQVRSFAAVDVVRKVAFLHVNVIIIKDKPIGTESL